MNAPKPPGPANKAASPKAAPKPASPNKRAPAPQKGPGKSASPNKGAPAPQRGPGKPAPNMGAPAPQKGPGKPAPNKPALAGLAVEIDGVPLPEEDAVAVWRRFSEWMEEKNDLAGFAAEEGVASVRPTVKAGRPTLLVTQGRPPS